MKHCGVDIHTEKTLRSNNDSTAKYYALKQCELKKYVSTHSLFLITYGLGWALYVIQSVSQSLDSFIYYRQGIYIILRSI